jgi:glycosyltransferase involved in cell wall biosynthesis
LERRLLRASDAIVPVSESFLPVIAAWGIPAERVTAIPNWAPLDHTTASISQDNDWSRRHQLANTPVIAYTGTLGRKHNPSLLLALARELPQVRILVVAEGVGATWLQAQAPALPNLVLLPLQPAGRLNEVLATADILVALLEADASEFSEPSKVLTYLAAGRPILAAIPRTNRAARTILEARAGLVVDPADRRGFIDAARALLADHSARADAARSGRAYAERRFDIEAITDRFESVLQMARAARAGTSVAAE